MDVRKHFAPTELVLITHCQAINVAHLRSSNHQEVSLFFRNIIKPLFLLAFMFGLLLSIDTAYAQTKLLRFPDIHGDRVVFTYAGDLGPRQPLAVQRSG